MITIKVAVVGSQDLTVDQSVRAKHLIRLFLNTYGEHVEVISGGALGIDTLAAQIAHRDGYRFTEYRPKNFQWDGPEGFKERNKQIAETCDTMLCIRSIQSNTYGSGWTADYAEQLGKTVWRYYV